MTHFFYTCALFLAALLGLLVGGIGFIAWQTRRTNLRRLEETRRWIRETYGDKEKR